MAGVRNPDTEEWTDVRIEILKSLKLRGYSASQIAKQLGGTTRCAVIAKLHRLGLYVKDAKGKTRPAPTGYSEAHDAGNKGKGKVLDLSPPERLAVRRFSWERADANP